VIYIEAGPTGSEGQSVLEGTISAATPSVPIYIKGTWTNTGTFNIAGGTLELDGSFKTSDIGTIVRNGGVLQMAGSLNNATATLALSPTTGNLDLVGNDSFASITGGTITSNGGAGLVVPVDTIQATLSSLTLAAPLSVGGRSPAPAKKIARRGSGAEKRSKCAKLSKRTHKLRTPLAGRVFLYFYETCDGTTQCSTAGNATGPAASDDRDPTLGLVGVVPAGGARSATLCPRSSGLAAVRRCRAESRNSIGRR